jgi:hypothetical protein
VAHIRKRKIISHIFSQKSTQEFEPRLHAGINSTVGLALRWQCQVFNRGRLGMTEKMDGEGVVDKFGWVAYLLRENIHLSVLARCDRAQQSRLRHRW